ncbi:sugar ABC transporter ATP-binding protein [Verrucomicrobium spinosum]|uniref:sugar ABC transporter ATP-binding protein n=1 Tax=Verrucomicrobium spinosum TaxID=2736 RepID=UPI0001746644|nr:sugar ABC transporter ATP-binding protein [Verrucomicrobium spinosum]
MSDLLSVQNLSKQFPGVRALDDVSLAVAKGELVAVIGENGAGKSTLMKILAGMQSPDRGQIQFEGRTVGLSGVQHAQSLGIALIHQELVLADNLDAAGNVFLGREPRQSIFIRHEVMRQRAQILLDQLGAGFLATTPVADLSLGQRQLVEIAKALSLDAKLIIMDEPTSSLSLRETETLFRVIADLRSRGLSILYISHRLGEVKLLADRVVALRDGRNVGALSREEITHDAMVRLMVGRDLSGARPLDARPPGERVLEVKSLRTQAFPANRLTFHVCRGEMVGLAGLVGAGRTEVLRALFGVVPPLAGEVRVAGQLLPARHPDQAVAAGLALVPEDRKTLGVFLEESVQWNVALTTLARDAKAGIFVNEQAGSALAADLGQQLRIKAASPDTLVGTLSGGNQQKVVLGKWLALAPKVLLLDEPTRGIDVGAKAEIYQLMERLTAEGMAVLFASSEMEEVLAMSDRVLVMHEGRLSGELSRAEATEESIMALATGITAPNQSLH